MTTPTQQDLPSRHFRDNARQALQNVELRHSVRHAMDYLMDKRRGAFADDDELQRLRRLGETIRQRSLARLPALLETLEARLTANGIQVHWAETADEANRIIARLITARQGRLAVKGKSMVSEETGLNRHLEARGIEAVESDMGEYILQLADEHPTHIIMPAIHKTRAQIARLFCDHLPGTPYTEDVDALIRIGRNALRQLYVEADVGLSGVNFAVAETGTLCLVENEGNGRMCTTVPDMHIAITGIEKVVERLDDVVPLYSLLTRSAIGQPVTTYFNLISSPRRPGERDGPKEVHLVLLDNGRSQAYADLQLRKTLQCIRCGACMNHCPVYARIGGHAYGTTYPGPIGEILSPHLLGLDNTAQLPTASTLCGACSEVCPVRIPIPDLLLRLRTESQRPADDGRPVAVRGQGAGRSLGESLVWRTWRGLTGKPLHYRMFGWTASRLRALAPLSQSGWTRNHVPLVPAARTLHQLLQQREKSSS